MKSAFSGPRLFRLRLQGRLMWSTSTLMLLLIVITSGMFLWSQRSALDSVSSKVSTLVSNMQNEQADRLGEITTLQESAAETSLRTKTGSLGRLVAGLASIPLLTFDTEALDQPCEQTCRDPDVVLCYISDADGNIQSTYVDVENEIVRAAFGGDVSIDVSTAAQSLVNVDGIRVFRTDVVQDDQVIGQVVLLTSDAAVREQIAVIEEAGGIMEQQMAAMSSSMTNDVSQKVREQTRHGAAMAAIVATVALTVTLILILFLTRSITKPLKKGVVFAQAIARGDLTRHVDVESKDELGDLASALNDMASGLRKTIRDVAAGAERIESGSGESSAAGERVCGGVSQQTADLEEMSATVEEISSMISQNADNAQEAASLAAAARLSADQGQEQMQNMTQVMDGISEASAQISTVTKVIGDIAFQTNLLALNAAIEAEGAGAHGKRFAVVAEEVRKLAERSAEAAKSTGELIEKATSRADEGVAVAGGVAEALGAIGGSVKDADRLLGEIASASQTQSDGVAVMNNGVTQLADSAQEIMRQTSALRGAIDQFEVGDGTVYS